MKDAAGRLERRAWTTAEDDVLRLYVGTEVRLRDLADLFPTRSLRSIDHRLRRLRRPGGNPTIQDRALLEQILVFCHRHDLSQRQFGAMAVGSPGFVSSMRQGRHVGEALEKKLREFMARGNPRPRTHGSWIGQQYRRAAIAAVAEEAEKRLFRESDPVERAKTFIRRDQRLACFEAQITRPEHNGKYFIGSRLVTRDELLEFARRKGWKG